MANKIDGKKEREERSRIKMYKVFDEQNVNKSIKDYYNYQINAGYSYKTCEDYTKYAIRFRKHMEDNQIFDYAAVKKGDVNDFLASLSVDVKGNPKRVSDSYKAIVWSALKSFFDYLSDDDIGVITVNPMNKIKRPKVQDECSQVFLTQGEIQKMFENIQNQEDKVKAVRDELLIRVFLISGARLSAVVDLNVADIKEGKIRFLDKGNKRKVCPLDKSTISLLENWLRIRTEILISSENEEDALFINISGKRISTKLVERMVERYTVNIDKHITPHKLRATYASQLYLKTKDPLYIQEMMGHVNLTTTQRYLKGLQGDSEKAVEIMSGILK